MRRDLPRAAGPRPARVPVCSEFGRTQTTRHKRRGPGVLLCVAGERAHGPCGVVRRPSGLRDAGQSALGVPAEATETTVSGGGGDLDRGGLVPCRVPTHSLALSSVGAGRGRHRLYSVGGLWAPPTLCCRPCRWPRLLSLPASLRPSLSLPLSLSVPAGLLCQREPPVDRPPAVHTMPPRSGRCGSDTLCGVKQGRPTRGPTQNRGYTETVFLLIGVR